jgi:hypothetical protein
VSEGEVGAELGPYCFMPTQEEAAIAASRAALRSALTGLLSLHHAAPLVAFVLVMTFVAILAFTGLMARRLAESALILAAIAFMAARMAAHWGLRRARKRSLATTIAPRDGGEVVVRVEDAGLIVETAAGPRRFEFADCDEAEYAGGIVYLWPRAGAPAFIPMRAFADEQTARAFAGLLGARIRRPLKR